jgi:hypothetical protein
MERFELTTATGAAMRVAALALLLAACSPEPQPTTPGPAPEIARAPPMPAEQQPATDPDPALNTFLQTRTRDAMAPLGYVARTTGEGADALTLVYLVGPEYCGSGGCNLLILRRAADGYAVLGETTVTQAPIRILSTATNGLPDIGVRVRGGGVTEGYEARLTFDGARYPSNPTVAPAARVDGADGVTLITDADPKTALKS